jgi:hypothetical protein
VNVEGDQNTFEINAATTSNYNFFTSAPASCRNFAQVEGARSSNFTASTAAYSRFSFTSSSINAPGGDWSLAPDASALQYDGDDAYGFVLEACLQSAVLFDTPLLAGREDSLWPVQLYRRLGRFLQHAFFDCAN